MDETSNKCQNGIEINNIAQGEEKAKCVLYGEDKTIKVYSSIEEESETTLNEQDIEDYLNEVTEGVKKDSNVEYHIKYFKDNTCGTLEKDFIASKIENKPENTVITVTLKETTSETGSETSYVEYI
ncbi:hypothetical protein KM1_334620, partial [Entamoeba histolytica HM-3:IMSS]